MLVIRHERPQKQENQTIRNTRRHRTVAALAFALLFAIGLVSNVYSQVASPVAAIADRPSKFPQETGFVGDAAMDKVIGAVKKHSNVNADGDLSVSIPLYSIPGQIPVGLNLSYKSGIKLDQSATWVGLGWNLAGWSVKRIAVHGDDPHNVAYVSGTTNTRWHVNDVYSVNIPGRSMKFNNIGSMDSPIFKPTEYSNDSLFGFTTSVDISSTAFPDWVYYRQDYFVLVDAQATRYVFKLPLKRMTVRSPEDDYIDALGGYAAFNVSVSIQENAEWLLTAILSHDYVDGGGDALDPMDSQGANKGWWVGLNYNSDNFAKDEVQTVNFGGYDDKFSSHEDKQDITYLKTITTPSTITEFSIQSLNAYQTINWYRTEGDPGLRVKGRVLTHIKAYPYQLAGLDESNLPKELFSATLSYENSDPALKTKWHASVAGHPASVTAGEATLRSVAFGLDNSYVQSGSATSLYKNGNKKFYSFEYDKLLDTGAYYNSGLNFPLTAEADKLKSASNAQYGYSIELIDWTIAGNFGVPFFPYQLNDPNFALSNNPSSRAQTIREALKRDWRGRDFFGYNQEFPSAWSMTKLTTPDGMVFEYKYESDRIKLGVGFAWNVGGCRVASIAVNPISTGFGEQLINDYVASDTIHFEYGIGSDGIGFPTSMPGSYHSYLESLTSQINTSGAGEHFTSNYELFLNDHASHVVQYPRILWKLPRDRGTIEYLYTTTNDPNIPANAKKTMDIGNTTDFFGITGVPMRIKFSMWQDHSPMHGLLYQTTMRNSAAQTLLSEVLDYEFVAQDAQLFVADGIADVTNNFPLTLGNDTISATYFVKLNSIVTESDGVSSTETFAYNDALHRRTESVKTMNDFDLVTTTSWPTALVETGLFDNHYLGSRVESITYRRPATGPDVMLGKSVFDYENNFPSQSGGSGNIFYNKATRIWIDDNGDGVLIPSELIAQNVMDDVDKYGNPIFTHSVLGTHNGGIYSVRGIEAAFVNVHDSDFAIFTGEASLTDQPYSWAMPAGSELDTTFAFTGLASAKITNSASTVFGPTVQFAKDNEVPTLDGKYIVECWAWCSRADNKLRLTAVSQNNTPQDTKIKYVTMFNEWTLLTCTVSVNLTDTLIVYIAAQGYGGAYESYVDDIRVYPAGALATSFTYDALGRQTTVSDFNNTPVRTFYDQYGDVLVTADHNSIPLSGQEVYFKTSDDVFGSSLPSAVGSPYIGLGTSGSYSPYLPNSRITFSNLDIGVVDDFAQDPFSSKSKWVIEGASSGGELNWDRQKKEIVFKSNADDLSYRDLILPVGDFTSGFVAFDITREFTLGTCNPLMLPYSSQINPLSSQWDPTATSLWVGFDDGSGRGYSASYGYGTTLSLVRINPLSSNYYYDLDPQKNGEIIGAVYNTFSSFKGLLNNQTARVMFGKMGDHVFVFLNGDCIYYAQDSEAGYDVMSNVRISLRARENCQSLPTTLKLDNFVFHNNPTVVTEFLNSFGLVKQTQIFDGDSITTFAQTNTLDLLPQVTFLPIKNLPIPGYEPLTANQGNIYNSGSHFGPFDFIDQYVPQAALFNWSPGDPLPIGQLWLAHGSDENSVPYNEIVYSIDPLRRVVEIRPEGIFRDYSTRFEYGSNAVAVPGFDALDYGPSTVFETKKIESFSITVTPPNQVIEKDVTSVSFTDKMGNVIASIQDESGIAATTIFYRNVIGLDTLVIQPEGHKIARRYNNVGWLMTDSSGDYGLRKYTYDALGRERFSATAQQRLGSNLFSFKNYDPHGRLVYEGFKSDTLNMTFNNANAVDPPYPDTSTGGLVYRTYGYDLGEFGRGRLTSSSSFPEAGAPGAGYADHNSTESFVYDEFGRLTSTTQNITWLGWVDGLKTMSAQYDLLGQVTQLTYPNGQVANYTYDPLGRVTQVDNAIGATAADMKVQFDYFPNSQVKTKTLGSGVIPAQVIDYQYNSRGWLTSINGGAAPSFSMSGIGDHYSLELSYENNAFTGAAGIFYPTGYVNGNISKYDLTLSGGNTTDMIPQSFAYDNLNRLVAQDINISNAWPQITKYTYDKNGRILKLDELGGL
ncbi:RHS repeat protein, partial [bacterium AH-315-J21]|nr:RHS repeat protein [bacterium AH-315-J21]